MTAHLNRAPRLNARVDARLRGALLIDSYLHVYLVHLRAFDGDLRLVKALAHYTGADREKIRRLYKRVHDDVLYEKRLGAP
jgi:hypothetical protein